MRQCPICHDSVQDFEKPRIAHLVLHKAENGHVHIHGDLKKTDDIKDMLDVAATDLGIVPSKKEDDLPSEIVFHNRQRIGDMLMFTCAIRDFKKAYPQVKVNVIATAKHIFDYNQNIDTLIVPTDKNTVKIGPGWLTNKSNSVDWHFANAYRVSIEQALKIHIPQGESRPDIWFTEEEYHAPRVIANPYWIICINGEKGWGCKMYPFVKWQGFVNQNPDITFVQIGTIEDNPPRLQGSNVIDYVGKTQNKDSGIRDLFKLFLNAEGSIGLVSFHMHLSGAIYKPCIVVAGAREPVSFTRYAGHAYLSTDGMLPCAVKACWHCGIETCTVPILRPDQTGKDEIVPKCVDMIEPEDITCTLRSYYKGGRLKIFVPSDKPKLKNVVPTPEVVKMKIVQPALNPQGKQGIVAGVDRKFIKVISTARGWGGAGRSVTTIMKMLLDAGHKVEFIPFRNAVTSSEWKAILKGTLQNVKVTENYDTVHEQCDLLFMYADDYIWEFGKPDIVETFSEINADRKVMMLNYRRGKVGELGWTKGWDKYMFLNSTQEFELLKVLPGVRTKVLPPCTDLKPFFAVQPDYNYNLRIVRHSSQGDTKFDKIEFIKEVDQVLISRNDVELNFLPGPSFVHEAPPRIKKFPRTAHPDIIANFLAKGNFFWYSLPKGYMDMGPRVILEAMAAGLPVLADNWGGAKDRVPRETGWLCDDKSQHVEIIKHVTYEELKKKGQAARAHAAAEFVPGRWVQEIFN